MSDLPLPSHTKKLLKLTAVSGSCTFSSWIKYFHGGPIAAPQLCLVHSLEIEEISTLLYKEEASCCCSSLIDPTLKSFLSSLPDQQLQEKKILISAWSIPWKASPQLTWSSLELQYNLFPPLNPLPRAATTLPSLSKTQGWWSQCWQLHGTCHHSPTRLGSANSTDKIISIDNSM